MSAPLRLWADTDESDAPCAQCDGTGRVVCETCHGEGDCECGECGERTKRCGDCRGDGSWECEACLSLGSPAERREWMEARIGAAIPAEVRAAVMALAAHVKAPTEPRFDVRPHHRGTVRWRVEIDTRPSRDAERILTAAGFYRAASRKSQTVTEGPLGVRVKLPGVATWAWFSEVIKGPTDADRRAAGVSR